MFDENKCSIGEEVNAGKVKISDDEAWEVLAGADELIIGRGKKFSVYQPSEDNKEEILKQSLGRTGNLRAPTLKIGKKVIVGFNDEMYAQYIK